MYRVKLDPKGLPQEIPLLQKMLIDVFELAEAQGRKIEQLTHKIELLMRQSSGRSSEKLDPDQGRLGFDSLLAGEGTTEASPTPGAETSPPGEKDGDRPKGTRKGHGRRPIPSHLPRRRVEYRLLPSQRCGCGGELHEIGPEDPTSHLEYYPALFFVWEQVRMKYGCRSCNGPVVVGTDPTVVNTPAPSTAKSSAEESSPEAPTPPAVTGVVATLDVTVAAPQQQTEPETLLPQVKLPAEAIPLPRPIEKGLPGPGLLAQVITGKFADHLPLYRQQGIYARSGVQLARSTLCGWVKACSEILEPLWSLMCQLVVLSFSIHTDDTILPVLDRQLHEARKGRAWVYWGDDKNPYVVFDFTPSRERDGPVAFLKNFRGYLQADAYGGYDGIYKGEWAIEVACFAHARRKYFDARTKDLARAQRALTYIGALYDIERKAKEIAKERKLPLEEFYALRYELRQNKSKELLAIFRTWIDSDECKGVLPKSPMGVALTYTLNQWAALNRYIEDGRLEIDNNTAEREMKAIATGRKNWLFSGNNGAAKGAAILYSIVRTCKRHDIDTFAYLRDVLVRLPQHPQDRLHELLPHNWKLEKQANLNGLATTSTCGKTVEA